MYTPSKCSHSKERQMAPAKILVIDDDETILEIVKNVLDKRDFDTILAENGETGFQKAQTESPDAILLDRKMPGMNGNDVLKKLKRTPATSQIPVVMLTGDNNITDVTKSLELGAEDYIVKPFNNENLIIRIKNVLRKKQD